jgi:hypothetical protein
MANDPGQKRAVQRSIAKLRSYNTQYSTVLADMLRATLAVHDGAPDLAIARFTDAMELGERTHLFFIAAVARRQLGLLLGDEQGRAQVVAAELWMRQAGIKNVERMTTLMSPCALRTNEELISQANHLLPSIASLET